MENESSIGQPIPTAILTPTEIIAPPELTAEPAHAQAAIKGVSSEVLTSASLVTEMIFAPIVFWTSMSASYFRLLSIPAPLPVTWQRDS